MKTYNQYNESVRGMMKPKSDEDIDKIIEVASNAGVSPETLGRLIYSSQEHRMINPSEGTE